MQKMVHALNRFAPLVMRAHLALPHPCGVRPWLLPRHHNNEISFLFLFAFPFLLFCLPPNVFLFLFASQCQSPMSESQRQLSQSKPAPGNKCKSKVYNVCSDVEWVVDGENERPALRAFGCARWPCCRQQEQEQRVSAAEVELQQQCKKRKYGVCKLINHRNT